MKSFFFIPASKLSKISSIREEGVYEIVIDLEDAISSRELNLFLEDIILLQDRSYFIRVPVIKDNKVNFEIINKLIVSGFKKFMLPKLSTFKHFNELSSNIKFPPKSIIILIENPKLLFDIPKLLEEYSNIIFGICLGSHDYIAEIGGLYTLNNLEYPRQLILNYARMFNIMAIDIASMDISNFDDFEKEVIDGFNKGYDAKLLIHPKQLMRFKNLKFYSAEDYNWAIKVITALNKTDIVENFTPVVINGKIVERPHIKRAKLILEWFNYH